MAGNAHRSRPRNKPCDSSCVYCKNRPSEARAKGIRFRNKNGHRHNPAANKKQKR